MKIHSLQKFVAMGTIGLSLTASAMAQVIVNDTFSSGTANGNGYYAYNTAGGELWTVSGGAMVNSGSSAPNTVMNKSFTAVTLDTVGESLTSTYSFRNLQAAGTIVGTMEIGLYNVGSTISANSIGGTNPIASKAGFTHRQNNNEQVLYLREKTTTPADLNRGTWWNGRTDLVPSPLVVPWISTSANTGYITNTMTLTMTVGGLQVASTTAGNAMPTYLATGVMTYTVDTISIFHNWGGGTGSRFSQVDNVSLTYAIPEPGSFALLGMGVASLLVLRRRRRA